MIEVYSDEELLQVPCGTVFVYDVESYVNFFVVSFRNIVDDKHVIFEYSPDKPLEIDKLRWFVWRFCLVGFNSNNYDIIMLTLALWGMTPMQLKGASDKIIYDNLRPYEMQKEYGIEIPPFNHVDLIEVAPLEASLKLYGGRLHCRHMRDLPYEPNAALTREQAADLVTYNCNDLEQTKLLLIELAPHIELRQNLSQKYGRDMRSLSDAQVAEAIINGEIHKVSGVYPRRPKDAPKVVQYEIPQYMRFQTTQLQEALNVVGMAAFHVQDNGSLVIPESITKLRIRIGGSVYKMGIGGLHSQEKEVHYVADENTYLIDRDVASYYPRIILNQGLYPPHLGPIFLTVFNEIVDRRLAAKKAGNKKESEGLKIAINGTFGKTGSPYSSLYAPNILLQVTMTGQLTLLLLIEAIELAGIPVVSGNTDGVIVRCPKDRYEDLCSIVRAWEAATGFETEETRYRAVYARDVNNYVAVKEKPDPAGKFLSDRLGCKVKGTYAEFGSAQNSVLSKNPESLVCNDAVLALIANGTPVEQTIRECKDVRRFVNVRTVKGGALKNGEYLGKAIRWYYAKGESGTINYKLTGNKVPKSDGARPLMVLPDSLPSDIDYDYYIREAVDMLFDLSFYQRSHTPSFF